MNSELPNPESPQAIERRRTPDRRQQTFRALLYGSFMPRRRGGRRRGDAGFAHVDWHHPKWLAVALLILLFSAADALLTLTLVNRGAYEANPVMAPLVNGDARAFAVAKIGLTAAGVILLTLLAGIRAFGRLPVGVVLYGVLVVYAALVAYEFWLLERLLAEH